MINITDLPCEECGEYIVTEGGLVVQWPSSRLLAHPVAPQENGLVVCSQEGGSLETPRGPERGLEGALAELREQLGRMQFGVKVSGYAARGAGSRQQVRVPGAATGRKAAPAPRRCPCGPRGVFRYHLRQQDAGLRAHLDQVGQQISELQLGVCRGASEAPDGDSRPSSGFYELSDVASCSRSTSCTSVCSESVSSSRSNLQPGAWPPTARPGEYRPRSADETTVCAAPGPAPRPHISEGRAEGRGGAWGSFRPRPVSTGDLERAALTEVSQRAGTHTQSRAPLSCGVDILPHTVDPKYQSDLVSRSGKEVYAYPSPLHAVALQSPLFTLTTEPPQVGSSEHPRDTPPSSMGVSSLRARTRPIPETSPAGAYIDKLLRRSQGWGSPLRGSMGEWGFPRCGVSPPQQVCSGQSVGQERRSEKLVSPPGSKEGQGVGRNGDTPWGSPTQLGPLSQLDAQQPAGLPEVSAPSEDCILGKITWGPLLVEQESPPDPHAPLPHSAPRYWDNKADLTCKEGGTVSPSPVWRQLVHTPFAAVPGAYPSRLKTGSPRVRATKVKRRASNRALRFGREALRFPDRQWEAHRVPWLSPEWDPSQGPHRDDSVRGRVAMAREVPGRAFSETSLYPVPFLVPLLVARRENRHASAQVLYPLGAAPLGVAASSWARKQQRRWQSSVQISAGAHPGQGPRRPPGRRAGAPQGRRLRPGPCGRSESRRSEHLAECGSLVRSTITETSEDEDGSDHTANRFGDGESSNSEGEGGCGQGRSGLVLGQGPPRPGKPTEPPAAALQPSWASAGPRPPPMPRLCRVKASRALKKKIRRFQPAALRVMTMM
ncbi:dapper homolog 2 [Orycteropus afer afer]|uniref:Dapper homolog 2 n=1 Tax=Orycteropus afer afer TaxID=1230840 RepID=A0A8B7ALJ3_ORYAF|nr:dapper homolog 2 [Orycteropus afer afer]